MKHSNFQKFCQNHWTLMYIHTLSYKCPHIYSYIFKKNQLKQNLISFKSFPNRPVCVSAASLKRHWHEFDMLTYVFINSEVLHQRKYILLGKYEYSVSHCHLSRRSAFEGTVVRDFVAEAFCIRPCVWTPMNTS
jgi:hypothetical protein